MKCSSVGVDTSILVLTAPIHLCRPLRGACAMHPLTQWPDSGRTTSQCRAYFALLVDRGVITLNDTGIAPIVRHTRACSRPPSLHPGGSLKLSLRCDWYNHGPAPVASQMSLAPVSASSPRRRAREVPDYFQPTCYNIYMCPPVSCLSSLL